MSVIYFRPINTECEIYELYIEQKENGIFFECTDKNMNVCNNFNSITKITSVVLYGFRDLGFVDMLKLLIPKQIKKITLLNCVMDIDSSRELINLIRENHRLKKITFNESLLGNNFEGIFLAIIKNQNIVNLTLVSMMLTIEPSLSLFVPQPNHKSIIEILHMSSNLKKLNLDICDHDLDYIGKYLLNNVSIEDIIIRCMTSSELDTHLIYALCNNITLKTIKIKNVSINDSSAILISSMLKNSQLLSSLIINTKLKRASLDRIIPGLENNTTLKYLKIKSKCGVSTICKILKAIKSTINLETALFKFIVDHNADIKIVTDTIREIFSAIEITYSVSYPEPSKIIIHIRYEKKIIMK